MFESCCVVFIPPKSVNPAVSVHTRLRSCFGPARVCPVSTVLTVWVGCSVCTAGWIHTYASAPEAQPHLSTCWRHSSVFWALWMRGGELNSSVHTAEPSGVITCEQASRETHIFRVIATDKKGGQCCLSRFTRDTCETEIDLCAREHIC